MVTDFVIFVFILGLILGLFSVGITAKGREFFKDLFAKLRKLVGLGGEKENPDEPKGGVNLVVNLKEDVPAPKPRARAPRKPSTRTRKSKK